MIMIDDFPQCCFIVHINTTVQLYTLKWFFKACTGWVYIFFGSDDMKSQFSKSACTSEIENQLSLVCTLFIKAMVRLQFTNCFFKIYTYFFHMFCKTQNVICWFFGNEEGIFKTLANIIVNGSSLLWPSCSQRNTIPLIALYFFYAFCVCQNMNLNFSEILDFGTSDSKNRFSQF